MFVAVGVGVAVGVSVGVGVGVFVAVGVGVGVVVAVASAIAVAMNFATTVASKSGVAVAVGVLVGCAMAVAVISATTVARMSGVAAIAMSGGADEPPHAADTNIRAITKTVIANAGASLTIVSGLLSSSFYTSPPTPAKSALHPQRKSATIYAQSLEETRPPCPLRTSSFAARANTTSRT